MWTTYFVIAAILVVTELVYFRIADHINIIDKPNERSSHTRIVLRGGGVIFTIALWIWYFWQMVQGEWCTVNEHWPLLTGVTLVAGVSFIDDIHSLPASLRLIVQFASMFLVLYGLMFNDVWLVEFGIWVRALVIIAALIVCVGAMNIYNFMDGINGIILLEVFMCILKSMSPMGRTTCG